MSSRRGSRKRRQVSEDEESQAEVIPSAVGSSSARAVATTCEVELVSPETWEEIPELLFVKMQNEDAEEVAEALDNLRELMECDDEDDKNIETAFRFGAPALVVLTMKKFQYHEGIQRHGCACLQCFAFLHSNIETILQTGGMESLINALKIFPDSGGVQEFGVGALMNLLNSPEKDYVNRACKRFVNDLDGIQLTLAAMEKFFDDREEVVDNCCGVLWDLAKIKDFHEPMKAAGVMSAIGKALDKCSDREDVKRHAGGCMKAMMK